MGSAGVQWSRGREKSQELGSGSWYMETHLGLLTVAHGS